MQQQDARSSTYGGPDATHAVIPQSRPSRRVLGSDRARTSSSSASKTADDMAGRAQALQRGPRPARYGFDPTDDRASGDSGTRSKGQKMQAEDHRSASRSSSAIIGALTLIIGGVGVANIMYAVVKERTREIGVKMALGARRGWITGPFVLEGLVYTLVGGLVGAADRDPPRDGPVASCRSRATTSWSSWAGPRSPGPSASPRSRSSGRCGLLAGYFPARRAASIDPASTLRYE